MRRSIREISQSENGKLRVAADSSISSADVSVLSGISRISGIPARAKMRSAYFAGAEL
jgi:hypothetical protein